MAGMTTLKDKVAVVTGAGSGIGRATAMAFAREGADLVLADIQADRLEAVKKEIEKAGGRAMVKTADVSDSDQVKALAEFAIAQRGRVDILFNNAGVSIGARFENTSLEDFHWIFGINFWGVVHGVHHFLPHFIRQQSGHIVNTSSILGLTSGPGASAYASTKFAVAGLGESLRAELARHHIGVTTICPGVIQTRIVEDGRVRLEEGSRINRNTLTEFYRNRAWPPERVARAVVKAVKKNRGVVPVGPEAWAQWFLKRFSQRIFEFFLRRADRFFFNKG